MGEDVLIDLRLLYGETAKLSEIDSYLSRVLDLAGDGNFVTITGAAPVWLYLKVAHALHGKARRLTYRSPATGDIRIFDHNAF